MVGGSSPPVGAFLPIIILYQQTSTSIAIYHINSLFYLVYDHFLPVFPLIAWIKFNIFL